MVAGKLPDANVNGYCVDCERRKAVTTDGRFCFSCLRNRINNETPIPKRINDQKGRKARDMKTIGGQAEMRTDGDD